jgi:nitric oxide reductase subunit C
MAQTFTKTMARNIFYGGSAFFFLLFLALTFDTSRALPSRDNRPAINEKVARGKQVWEHNNCIGCHTLLGEGAYFAPELGNVYKRFGSKEAIIAWIKAQPTGVPGRRQMPQFDLSEQDLDSIAEFLKYASEINAAKWPPNING